MRWTSAVGVIGTLLLLGPAPPLGAQDLGPVIVNSAAEEGAAAADSASIVSVPGWETTGGFTVVAYGTSGPFPAVPPMTTRASNEKFFTGGPGSPVSTATQLVPISEWQWTQFGITHYMYCNALIGGWAASTASASVVFSLLDGDETELCSIELGPVTPEDRSEQTGFKDIERKCSMRVPLESRFIRILIRIEGPEGAYNSGFVDNLSVFFFWPDPVLPTTWSRVKARVPAGP